MMRRHKRTGDVIDVRAEGPDWPQHLDDMRPRAVVRAAIAAALAACGPAYPVEVSALLTDARTIQHLNARYRGRDVATNVLAFALPQCGPEAAAPAGAPVLLGDVVIAGSVCRDEAAAQGKDFADHVRHLAVHGTLHLLGYDHETAEEAGIMERFERDILAELGVADPYDAPAAA